MHRNSEKQLSRCSDACFTLPEFTFWKTQISRCIAMAYCNDDSRSGMARSSMEKEDKELCCHIEWSVAARLASTSTGATVARTWSVEWRVLCFFLLSGHLTMPMAWRQHSSATASNTTCWRTTQRQHSEWGKLLFLNKQTVATRSKLSVSSYFRHQSRR